MQGAAAIVRGQAQSALHANGCIMHHDDSQPRGNGARHVLALQRTGRKHQRNQAAPKALQGRQGQAPRSLQPVVVFR